MDIGIDLGTTFSVIAVKGRVRLTDGYPEGQYLEECDVTIVPTPFGELEVPSVFWEDPSHPGEVIVGGEAKQKAQEGDSPIMFSKRNIGTDLPLKIGSRTYGAKEVAIFILRYLKSCAEQALGEPVRRAVVTHPAYFSPNQVEETKQAAKDAGFDMSLPEQMMMEPVAAALAYLRGVAQDPVRVMTYDLGGGTFDVTILERREGVTTMKAFDGDPLLGGYVFDRELVQWILDRLKQAGRVIPYNDENPTDRGRRARLLHLAETVKIKLSEQASPKVPVQIKAQDVLVDNEGRNVQILDRITREQYAALIKEHLDHTIECCWRALGKSEMRPDELDVILLVGGSTNGQWVREALTQAFGVEVIPFNPSLCVGAGAALRTGDLPPPPGDGGHGLKLVLDVLPTSALPTINVAGRLRADDGGQLDDALREELVILLETPLSGVLGPVHVLGAEGQFIFGDVQLLDDEPTVFTLQIADANGLRRHSESFSVRYSLEGARTVIWTSLPKPLFLKTAAGMRSIAEEGRQLPAQCEVTLRMLHNESDVDIPVYQEDVEIGMVHVGNIPPDIGEGSPVIVTVEVTVDNEIKGSAKVLKRVGGPVVAQCPVYVKFPPLALPSLPELHAEFEKLEEQREQLIALSGDPEQRLALGGKGAKLSRRLRKLFGEQAPERQELYEALKEMDRLVNPPPDDMDPPRTRFRGLIEESNDLMASSADPQLDALKTALARIERDGTDAYTTKNHKKWAAANESLLRLHDRVVMLMNPPPDPRDDGPPPTELQKDHWRDHVDRLRLELSQERDRLASMPAYLSKFKPRADAIEIALDKLEAAIDKVSDTLPPKQASGQLQVVMRPEQRLKKEIHNIEHAVE